MDRYEPGKGLPVEASAKLDGVYGRATKDGVFSKSGKPLNLPHIQKRLARYFRKHPDGALEGELHRKKAGIEAIAGEVKSGGDAAKHVKLHTYPGQAGRPWGFGATRQIKGTTVKDAAGVEKVYQRAIAKGHEGIVVRDADGKKSKQKPQQDREWPVVGTRNAEGGTRKKTVLTLKGDDGKPFKVQSAAGVSAKDGDQVSVRHSGLTNSGKPKAAVAYRVRNDKDFSSLSINHQLSTINSPVTSKEQDQIDKDRRTLKRGALLAGAGALGAYGLLKYSKGGIVRNTPSPTTGGSRLGMPKPKMPSGQGLKVTKTPEVIRLKQRYGVKGRTLLGPKEATPAERLKALGPKLGPAAPTAAERAGMIVKKPTALDNQTRKGGVKRAVKAATLREERAYGALKPPTQAKLAKVKPADRETYAAMDARARNVRAKDQGGLVTRKEQFMADQATRLRAREQLTKFRKEKRFSALNSQPSTLNFFMTPASRLIEFKSDRDRGDTVRDIAVGGGALASGGGALYAARKFGKTSEAATGAANAVKETAARFTPKEIAHAVGAEVTAKTKKTLKSYFPTFIKGGKKVSALLKKSFSTPASRLIEFGNDNQVRDPDTRRYNDPLKVAAGFQRGYTRKDKDNQPIEEDMPLLHAQVIKGAYNKGKKIQRVASRGSALLKDVGDTVRGKPREKDAAGRTKKKEWEKGWFKEGAKNVAVGTGLLTGAAYLSKHPEKRDTIVRGARKVTTKINKVIPDLFKAFSSDPTDPSNLTDPTDLQIFQTPASGFFSKLRGPSAAAKAGVASREALLEKLQSRVRMGGNGSDKAARVAGSVKKNLAGKKAKVKLADRYQKDAIRTAKKGAVIAGGGAALGAGAMKLHADQPENAKVNQGARLRNGLVGAAAGSFLGGGLLGGASGFKGARIGAALGGLTGLLSNPKRRAAIDDLQTASFEVRGQESEVRSQEEREFQTPAGRLIEFGKMPTAGTFQSIVRYGQKGDLIRGVNAVSKGRKPMFHVTGAALDNVKLTDRKKLSKIVKRKGLTVAGDQKRIKAWEKGEGGGSTVVLHKNNPKAVAKWESASRSGDMRKIGESAGFRKEEIDSFLDRYDDPNAVPLSSLKDSRAKRKSYNLSTPAGRLIEFDKNPDKEDTLIPLMGSAGILAGAYAGDRVRQKIDKATMAKPSGIKDPRAAYMMNQEMHQSSITSRRIAKRLSKHVDPKFAAKYGPQSVEEGVDRAARARYQEVGRRKLEKLNQIAGGKTGPVREVADAADRIGSNSHGKMVQLNKAGKRAAVPLRKRAMAKALLAGAKINKPGLIQGVGLVGGLAVGVGAGIYGDRKIKAARERKNFETPAGRLIHFDNVAQDAGWDIRDPRGKSARVFAPGSRQRVRRPKEWHEKSDNERKLWKAAVVAAGIGGLAGGHVLTKKLAKKAVIPPMATPGGIGKGPKMGPRSTQRREAFRSAPGDKPRWN